MGANGQFFVEVGDFSATFVTLQLSVAEAQSLLPSELQLGQQNLTPPGTYPLLCMFGCQKNVHSKIPFFDNADPEQVVNLCEALAPRHSSLAPLPLPLGYMDYKEVVTLLPFVDWAQPSDS